jgi:hypothetical protein
MELCFKPAIENFVNKDYDTIYIDTATFLDKDKKGCLRNFRNVAKDGLNVCYQADNLVY